MVYSGFDSHGFQYMQKVHTNSVNIRYIQENHYNLSKIEYIPNKANALLFQYVLALLRRQATTKNLCGCKGSNKIWNTQIYLQKNRYNNKEGTGCPIKSGVMDINIKRDNIPQ